MAQQILPLMHHPGVDVGLVYDDVTLAASAVQANNTSEHDCLVTITNIAHPNQSRSGTLRAKQQASFDVSGAVSLTRTVIAPSPTPVLALVGWNLSSRLPA